MGGGKGKGKGKGKRFFDRSQLPRSDKNGKGMPLYPPDADMREVLEQHLYRESDPLLDVKLHHHFVPNRPQLNLLNQQRTFMQKNFSGTGDQGSAKHWRASGTTAGDSSSSTNSTAINIPSCSNGAPMGGLFNQTELAALARAAHEQVLEQKARKLAMSTKAGAPAKLGTTNKTTSDQQQKQGLKSTKMEINKSKLTSSNKRRRKDSASSEDGAHHESADSDDAAGQDDDDVDDEDENQNENSALIPKHVNPQNYFEAMRLQNLVVGAEYFPAELVDPQLHHTSSRKQTSTKKRKKDLQEAAGTDDDGDDNEDDLSEDEDEKSGNEQDDANRSEKDEDENSDAENLSENADDGDEFFGDEDYLDGFADADANDFGEVEEGGGNAYED
ncbi:unnamed protein product [Amoebophrya sp. A120]|nr:unnamed protein product [Amoebophrya sp. A120]|eukprot:GSA120T00003811001.1